MNRRTQHKLKPAGFTISDSTREIVEEKAKATGSNFSEYVRESIEMRMNNEDIAERLRVTTSEMIEAAMLQIAADNRAAHEIIKADYASISAAFIELMKEMNILKAAPEATIRLLEAKLFHLNTQLEKVQQALITLANKK